MPVTPLDFAEPFYDVLFVEDEAEYRIGKKSMVLNVSLRDPADIELDDERFVPPLKGAVVADMTVRNLKKALIVPDVDRTDIDDPATADKIMHTWKSIYECSGIPRHKGLPYYKSPKFRVGEGSEHLEINFCFVSEGGVPSGPHREHDRDFDEVHAQIAGYGMMRIYGREDKEHIHQVLNMAPGVIHDPMYDSQGKYPWHEYKSATPCVYCPIELDRGDGKDYHPVDL